MFFFALAMQCKREGDGSVWWVQLLASFESRRQA